MYDKKLSNYILVVLSGAITGIAGVFPNSWLIWISLVPLFVFLPAGNVKTAMGYGLAFGLSFTIVMLYWLPALIVNYSGTSYFVAVIISLSAYLYHALYVVAFSVIYYLFNKNGSKCYFSNYFKVLFIAGIWVILEWIRMIVFPGISLLKDTLALYQARNLYGIQLVSITGLWGVSFIIVLVNFLIASAIKKKKILITFASIIIILLFYLGGYVIYNNNTTNVIAEKKIEIIQENIEAQTRWNESNGDVLARRFIDLNKNAAASDPDIVVWSETAIPWTYSEDDNLIRYSLHYYNNPNTQHLIGILTEDTHDTSMRYNSVYLINTDNSASGRYDKHKLLTFLETPFLSDFIKIPFFKENMVSNLKPGKDPEPLESKHGKIGVLICNESISPYDARNALNNGADFLVNMSNDSWGEGTNLVDLHFLMARLRAVETGRDVIINSNRGIAAIVKGNGVIQTMSISDRPQLITGTVEIYNGKSFYSKYGDWFVYLCMVIFATVVLANLICRNIYIKKT